jgi:hypothetical protein
VTLFGWLELPSGSNRLPGRISLRAGKFVIFRHRVQNQPKIQAYFQYVSKEFAVNFRRQFLSSRREFFAPVQGRREVLVIAHPSCSRQIASF